MEFSEILTVASEQQGLSAVRKRYSLAVGPPKKDPKVKGVHSAAVQAFLKRQEEERRKKELEEKKRKEELLAKRVELKHDRKARAMASRTKDNFRGYNGIPIEEKPKRGLPGRSRSDSTEAVESVTGDEMEQSEHSQAESEHESEEYEEKPSRISGKPRPPPKSAPPPLNFTDLLKLAEKKQYEPVEIKAVKKTEERPMTAEELREREYLERKHRKGGVVLKEKKGEKEMKHVLASSCSKTDLSQKEFLNVKHGKHSTDKHSFSKGSLSSQSGHDKKSKGPALASKPKHPDKAKPTLKVPLKSSSSTSHSKVPVSGGGKIGLSSHTPALKAINAAQKQSSVQEPSLKKTVTHVKPTSVTAAQHESIKYSNSKQASSSSATGVSLPRAKSSLSTRPERPGSSMNTGRGLQSTSSGIEPVRSGNSSGSGQRKSSSSVGPGRPGSSVGMIPSRSGSSSGPGRPNSGQTTGSGRPGSMLNSGLGRASGSGLGPGRPSSTSVGNVKPKCTVVSETISSKNLVPRLSSGQVNGIRSQQRPGIPPQGFPRSLPPITKRPYEDDEEEDSEMDDFIDDEGEPQEEISRHIREIFGYDRSRYRDESDYALRYMESSWREQQKEEAKSLRLGMQEDLEEQRREEEELKRKKQAKKLRTR